MGNFRVQKSNLVLEMEIQAELTRQTELEKRRDYVMNDEYVEKWAREQAHMVLPGDQPLVIITREAPLAPADPSLPTSSAPEAAPVPNWHYWWRLFFDTEPGKLWQ